LASRFGAAPGHTVVVENLAVGMFGSFIGGEFVAAMLRANPKNTAITLMAILLAVSFAVAALLLLGLMRRVVGPLRPSRAKPRR
jgi:uncharacterized membrane protein YeaQ/YmgE (transglycosylase-associated protein family)